MKKRVLFINYSLDIGGIETLILELCLRYNKEKIKPAVCVMKKGGTLVDEFRKNGIDVYEIDKKHGTDITYLSKYQN